MPEGWEPSGAWLQRFREALNKYFDEIELDLLISDYFAPLSFAGLSPAGVHKKHEYRIHEVLRRAGLLATTSCLDPRERLSPGQAAEITRVHAAYPWLTDDLAAIRRRFGPEDLAPELAAAGVEATIVVQTRSSLDETRELLGLAMSTSFVRGAIGWVDLTDPAIADVLAELRAGFGGQHLVGLRHQVHDEPDPAWLTRPDVMRGIRAVAAAGLPFDLLVRTRELPAALELGRSLPAVRLVIDHLAKPPIAAGSLEPWSTLTRELASLDNVACKLSGLVTEASWATWGIGDLRPYVDHALETFGAGRLVFGSDWPVCLLAAAYGDVLEAARQVTAGLSPGERAAVFGENARMIYRL